MVGDRAVSLIDVLQVMRDFEPFEPAGIGSGLVSWELHQTEPAVSPVIERAVSDALLEPAGVDDRSGQPLWRLTDQGRRRLGGAS